MKKNVSCMTLLLVMAALPLTGLAQEGRLTEEQKKEFSFKALDNVDRLGIYLEIIADKQSPPEDVQDATRLALQLFDSEDAIVEVSSLNRPNDPPRQFSIRDYLRRLKALNYTSIEIEWADIAYVSNLRRGSDGNYYGVVTITQRFLGYREGRPIYGDITEKHIEVVIRPNAIGSGGTVVRDWNVFLTKISVKVTRELY